MPASASIFSVRRRRCGAAARGSSLREYFVVADGKEGKRYDYVTHVAFTPDGAHLLYLATDRDGYEDHDPCADGHQHIDADEHGDPDRIRC